MYKARDLPFLRFFDCFWSLFLAKEEEAVAISLPSTTIFPPVQWSKRARARSAAYPREQNEPIIEQVSLKVKLMHKSRGKNKTEYCTKQRKNNASKDTTLYF